MVGMPVAADVDVDRIAEDQERLPDEYVPDPDPMWQLEGYERRIAEEYTKGNFRKRLALGRFGDDLQPPQLARSH